MTATPSIQSIAQVNAVIWISSLEEDEFESTEIILGELEPFLHAMAVPFQFYEPKSAAELIAILFEVERAAREDGLKPIIHFDTHGSSRMGIQIIETNEYVGWYRLNNLFRNINVATKNNLCVISMACYGLNVVKEITFDRMVPYYYLVASRDVVWEDFIESKVVPFYQDVFVNSNLVSAFERHLMSEMESFHCERLLYKAVGGYVKDKCLDYDGREERIRAVVDEADRTTTSRIGRSRRSKVRYARKLIDPKQAVLDRWARRLLGGKKISFTMADVVASAKCELARRSV